MRISGFRATGIYPFCPNSNTRTCIFAQVSESSSSEDDADYNIKILAIINNSSTIQTSSTHSTNDENVTQPDKLPNIQQLEPSSARPNTKTCKQSRMKRQLRSKQLLKEVSPISKGNVQASRRK